MARTHKRGKNEYSRLRFFIGQHNWADQSHLADAMFYLDGCYFLEAGGDSPRIQKLRRAYAGRVFDEIEKDMAANPEKAYEWTVFLSKLPMSAKRMKVIKERLKELLEIPKVKLYKEGLRDMRKFIAKYFTVSSTDYKKKKGANKIKEISAKLYEKYKTISLGEIFRLLGEPVPL
ncbi:MAG: hypothetical protein KAU12_02090 [Candidatus Omnitrophica bacterium]|nr:hypothetical protein [Candidatus Omnitrophota bacterium]